MRNRYFSTLISLLFACAILAQEETTWTSFVQSIEVDVKKETLFKISASCKIKSKSSSAMAGIWARVDNKDNNNGFFDNMLDRPIKSKDWKVYTVIGNLDIDSKTLNFGGLALGKGSFYFDSFKLFVEDVNGNFKQVKVLNPGFEEGLEQELPLKWILGIDTAKPTPTVDYRIKLNEDSFDGKFSILIEYTPPLFYLPQVFPIKN